MFDGGTYMKEKRLAILNITSYVWMVALNALAILLPMNNRTTQEISNQYHHILTPAGFTFAIWSVIYIALLVMVLYLLKEQGESVNQLGGWFILSSIANGLWIMAWHFDFLWLSLVLTSVIVVSLAIIYRRLQEERKQSKKMVKNIMISLPISIYFAWSIIAWVENLAVVLVQQKITGFGLSQVFWGNVAIALILGVTCIVIEWYKDIAFTLTVAFALFGVWAQLNQSSESIWIQGMALLSIGLVILVLIQSFRKKS